MSEADGEAEAILDILKAPIAGAGDEEELVSGALKEFNDGFADGWHGRSKKRRNGTYGRAFEHGKKARSESDYFLK